MAKALQCPDCGTRHPLDDVAHLRTFRCRQCRRLLKVPASVAVAARLEGAPKEFTRAAASARPDEPTRAVKANGTRKIPPSQRGDAIAEQTSKVDAVVPTVHRRVPRTVRMFIWALAIPLGLLPVLIVGRAAGVLSVNRAVDLYIGLGWGRFVPLLLVLPVWAATSATIAHVSIEGVARLRHR